jgi:anti-anti-sigma factor
MTVVAGDGGTATPICDRCGGEDRANEVHHDGDMAGPMVAGLGWSGSPFVTGTHLCPHCSADGSAPAAEPVRRDGPGPHGVTFEVHTRADNEAIVFTPLADLESGLVEHLRDDLIRATATHRHVVMNLPAARLIDSAGLGLLVRAYQAAKQHDATFSLAAPSRYVQTVLHTMRLDGVFRTFADQQSALEAVRQPTAGVSGS